MVVPQGMSFSIDHDVMFPEGVYLVGEIQPLTEYQSQEDRARNRPVRTRIDEATGLRLFKGTFADPSAATPSARGGKSGETSKPAAA
jgi:hypothetical protein